MKHGPILIVLLFFALPALGKKEQINVRILDQKESDREFIVSYPG
jgi:hypothetical protein